MRPERGAGRAEKLTRRAERGKDLRGDGGTAKAAAGIWARGSARRQDEPDPRRGQGASHGPTSGGGERGAPAREGPTSVDGPTGLTRRARGGRAGPARTGRSEGRPARRGDAPAPPSSAAGLLNPLGIPWGLLGDPSRAGVRPGAPVGRPRARRLSFVYWGFGGFIVLNSSESRSVSTETDAEPRRCFASNASRSLRTQSSSRS